MRQSTQRLVLALLGSFALLSGCFDTRIIPADSSAGAAPSTAGKHAVAGSSSASAGVAALGGAAGNSVAGALGGDAPNAAGQAGEPTTGGTQAGNVTWLTLVESQAPFTEPPNTALGIHGKLYAYKDDCAVLDWDPATRCGSGRLCTAGANFENWGVAVGFDFHATGPDDSPPDSKLVWNPEAEGVRGVTWRVSGNAPGLQLWVLNMAPAFQGECSEQTCEIAGPPDGAATPSLQDSLLFDHMVKDYWGGQGEPYTYEPAAVFALQFKLPAINVGSASFDFCIDALGVIR
ncbi:MAG TPA: hypothetical protein VHP33_01555 [Polyangiaceae bacterium]|nr:hypothetical protein [Polyangiaceae bacterium]